MLQAEETLIIIGFNAFLCGSDNSGVSTVSVITKSSIVPTGPASRLCIDLVPVNKADSLTCTDAIPCAFTYATKASALLSAERALLLELLPKIHHSEYLNLPYPSMTTVDEGNNRWCFYGGRGQGVSMRIVSNTIICNKSLEEKPFEADL